MKLLSRDFTRGEKILILALVIILLALFYYRFVDQPVRLALADAESERAALETELSAVQTRVAVLNGMQEALDGINASGSASYMASYNNSAAELELLNDVLHRADTYAVSFSGATRSGNQIRRNFSLQFTVDSFDAMKQIIESLAASPYLCLIDDVHASAGKTDADGIEVSATATFYETMAGGTPDAGLPADSAG